MIFTTLLEPYRYPKIVPIEVTVLRGARGLRLAIPLRRKYSDFVPKIWNIMAKLGYQKYLQKIYVSIDFDTPLLSPYYQLPIVVAILEAVGMLRLRHNIYSIGRFMADYSLSYPLYPARELSPFPGLFSTELEQGEKLEQYLNHIHTASKELFAPIYPMNELFPGVAFKENQIDFCKTPLSLLKRIPETTFQESSLQITYRHRPLSEQKLQLLQTLPHAKIVALLHKVCFCEKNPCICTKAELALHDEQLQFLKEYNH